MANIILDWHCPHRVERRVVQDAEVLGEVEGWYAWRGIIQYRNETVIVEGVSSSPGELPLTWYKPFILFGRYRQLLYWRDHSPTTFDDEFDGRKHEEDWRHYDDWQLSSEVIIKLYEYGKTMVGLHHGE